mgnify:FL=1
MKRSIRVTYICSCDADIGRKQKAAGNGFFEKRYLESHREQKGFQYGERRSTEMIAQAVVSFLCDRKHHFYYIKCENNYLKNDKLQWRKL